MRKVPMPSKHLSDLPERVHNAKASNKVGASRGVREGAQRRGLLTTVSTSNIAVDAYLSVVVSAIAILQLHRLFVSSRVASR